HCSNIVPAGEPFKVNLAIARQTLRPHEGHEHAITLIDEMDGAARQRQSIIHRQCRCVIQAEVDSKRYSIQRCSLRSAQSKGTRRRSIECSSADLGSDEPAEQVPGTIEGLSQTTVV